MNINSGESPMQKGHPAAVDVGCGGGQLNVQSETGDRTAHCGSQSLGRRVGAAARVHRTSGSRAGRALGQRPVKLPYFIKGASKTAGDANLPHVLPKPPSPTVPIVRLWGPLCTGGLALLSPPSASALSPFRGSHRPRGGRLQASRRNFPKCKLDCQCV